MGCAPDRQLVATMARTEVGLRLRCSFDRDTEEQARILGTFAVRQRVSRLRGYSDSLPTACLACMPISDRLVRMLLTLFTQFASAAPSLSSMKLHLLPVVAFACLLSASVSGMSPTPVPSPKTDAVWIGGEDGIKVYTIPGLLVTRSGVIIAYAEARESRGDGDKVDVVIKRSLDGGKTWSKNFFIEQAHGIENYVLATLVQDRVTGRVFFFTALRDEGLADRTTANHYRYSDDDGSSWSEPHDITDLLHAADEKLQAGLRAHRAPKAFAGDDPDLYGRKLVFFGPGRSIQLSAQHPRFPNRLVIPLFYIKDRIILPRARRGYGDAVLVSDDSGKTWSVPGIVPLGEHGSSELSIVELADGRLMINARSAPPESSGMSVAGRTVAYSAHGGATWTRPAPDRSGIPDYIETSSGLLRLSFPLTDPDGKSRILFSFPNSRPLTDPAQSRVLGRARANGTILLSYDEGQSWPVKKLLVPESFGYSNMDVLPDNTVVVIYENATGTLVNATRFRLEWLTDGRDRIGE